MIFISIGNVVHSCKFKAGRINLVLVEYLHKDALMSLVGFLTKSVMLSKTVPIFSGWY